MIRDRFRYNFFVQRTIWAKGPSVFGGGLWPRFFHRWHPEVALRYLPIVREIKKMNKDASILEVGSGGLGIAPYLKKEVTGVDNQFHPPYYRLLKRIEGNATTLPFENSSFDIVVSVDMLEHLVKDERKKAIFEMLRVAKEAVYIGVPSGTKAYQQDLVLKKIYRDRFGKDYDFLEEQIKFGLPEEKEIYNMIKTSAKELSKKVSVVIKNNENLTLRMFLMKGWMTKNPIVDFFFRKVLLLAIQLFCLLNQEPTYRKLFFVTII